MADDLIAIRADEACEPQPFLLWDTVWVQAPVPELTAQGGYGDWALAQADETQNAGGLSARAALHTAIMLQLFTDRRLPNDLRLDDGSEDPRGWWGDSVIYENDPLDRELGSLLWTLERGTLSEETALQAKEYAEDALAVLIEQGAAERIEVSAEAWIADGQLRLGVDVYSPRYGNTRFLFGLTHPSMQVVWQQLHEFR